MGRNWDGSLVVRIDRPFLGQVEDIGELYNFRHVEGRWLVDGIVHQGA